MWRCGLSISLGSAVGEIRLESSGVTKGVQSAVAAIKNFEAQTAGAGKNLDKLSQSGQQTGTAVAKGAQQAAQSLKQIEQAGSAAGSAVAKGAEQAAAGMEKIAKSGESASASFDRIGNTAGLLGGAVAAGLGVAVKSAADLQTAVTRISTIAPEIDVSKISAQLTDMSTRVAQTSTQLAEGLNQIFSSIDINQSDALQLTEQFAKGAVAASTDAQTFGQSILGVMSAYGLSVADASHLSDVFFRTLDKGVISGNELAGGLGEVTQSAKLAGINFDTLGALISGITREGGSAAGNLTLLTNALNKVVTKETQEGLQGLGIATKDASGNFRDIVAVLGDLKTKLSGLSTGEQTKILQGLFPDQQARAGVSILLGQLDTVKSVLNDNITIAGNAEAAYAKMGSTAAAQAQILRNTLIATLTEAGDIALPGLTATAEGVRKVLAAFNELPDGAKSAAVYTAEAAAAILLVGSAGIKTASIIGDIVTGARNLGTAMQGAAIASRGLVGALGPVAIALLALEAGSEILVGQTLPELIGNIIKYGDAWAKGHEEGAKTFNAAQSDARLLAQEIENATKRAEALKKVRDDLLNRDYFTAQKEDLLGGDPFKTNRAEIAYQNAEAERKTLVEKAAAQKAAVDLQVREIENRQQNQRMLESEIVGEKEIADLRQKAARAKFSQKGQDFIGPLSNAQVLAANGTGQLAQAATALGAVYNQVNPVIAAARDKMDAQSGSAGTLIDLVEQLTTATTEYSQAQATQNVNALKAANNQAVIDGLKGQASAMQEVQTAAGPLNAALAQIAAKQAQGIPLTQREADLYQRIPGYLGEATTAYNALVLAQAATQIDAIDNAGGINALGGEFGKTSGQAAGLSGELNRLVGQMQKLKEVQNAYSAENAELTGIYNQFKARADVLEEKKKTQGGRLDPAETAELEHYNDLMSEIAGKLGTNAAKERELAEARYANIKATKDKAAAEAELIKQLTPNSGIGKGAAAVAAASTAPPAPPPAAPAPVVVPVKLDPNAQAQIEGELAGFTYNPAPVKVPVQLDTKGLTGGAGVTASLFANAVQAQTVQVDVQDNASKPLAEIQQTLAEMNGQTTTPKVTVQDDGTAIIDGVTGALSTLGGITSTPTAGLNDQASLPLAGITAAVNALAGRTISITATVDTSSALAAIQNLRDHMPSSPSKLGAFRKLPTWDVYDGLRENSEDAVVSIQSTTAAMSRALSGGVADMTDEAAKSAAELANTVAGAVASTVDALNRLSSFRPPDPRRFQALHDALTPIIAAFGADAAASGEGGIAAAGDYADNAAKIVNLIASGADALEKLGNFKRPTDQAIRDFRDVSQYLIAVMLEVAQDSDQDLTEAGATWAESAGKVYASVSAGVDVLTKLQEFRRPTDRAVTDFRDVSQFLVNVMAQVAADAELGPVASAGEWAESAGKVFSSVSSGVDALVKLQTFQRPTDQAVQSFRDVSQFLVNVIAQVAADGEGPAFAGAASWADSAGKIFGALSSGVDALTKLGSFARPTDQAVNSFRDVAQYVVNVMAQVAADSDRGAVADAAQWAENAGKILAILSVGVEGFAALHGFEPPALAALQRFADTTALATTLIARAAGDMDADTLAHAGAYADVAGQIVGLIGSGVESLGKLATGDLALPDMGRLDAFARATRDAVLAIHAAAQTIDGPALSAAATYSDGAGRVVSLIGNGVEGFNGLATFVAPSAGQIAHFKSAVSATVIAIAQAAKEIDKDAVKAAGEYSEGAGKAVGLLGGAVSAFKSIGDKDFVVPSREAIDAVVSVTRYGVDQLIGISGSYGPGQLSQLSAFAAAAGAGYSALGAALDAGKALGTEGRITPSDALGQALSEFQAGLGPLGQLVTISQQYATQGAQIGANVAAAYNDIAGGLPGFNAQQATAAANVTVAGTAQTVIVHRHEPQVISLQFLGESGAWIVKSLTVDGGARQATAGLIAGEIASTLEAGAPA